MRCNYITAEGQMLGTERLNFTKIETVECKDVDKFSHVKSRMCSRPFVGATGGAVGP